MKLSQAFIILLASKAGITAAQTPYSCPAVGGSPVIITDTASSARIPITTDPNGLCTLVRRRVSDGLRCAPVARSYSGLGWEVSAGLFANNLSVTCPSPSGSADECDISLPPLGEGEEYVLESFSRALPPEATAARFLEQSTFGSTRASIDALVASGNDFESWVADQMALPPTTLREFYRRRVNPKYEFSSVVGANSVGPCDVYSRWRIYAITSRDMLFNRLGTGPDKYLTITQEAGITGYVWRVDGQLRTVTADPPLDVDEKALQLGARYKIENLYGRTWTSDCVGCSVYITAPGATASVEISNPAVSISAAEGVVPLSIINLPDFKSHDLPSVEDSTDYPLFNKWIKPHENAMLNTTSLEATGVCDGLPDWRNPLPWGEEGAQPGTFPSIFAKSIDSVSGLQTVFIYDRHLTLFENTVENPLPDGGGALVMATANLNEAGEQVKCHNAERNFYNEEGCILSTLSTACAANSKPLEVIVLNDANLAGMRALSSKPLYAAKGLELSIVYDETTGFNSPCADTYLTQWSRWIKDPFDIVCDNTANLGAGTYKIYQDMITGFQDMDDRNFDIVDASRIHKVCDAEDQGKTYLGKVKAHDGICWSHVHQAEGDVFDLSGADAAMYTIDGNTVTFTSTAVFESDIMSNHVVIGKYGDHVEITTSLPPPLDDPAVQSTYKTIEYNPANRHVLICGSPEEVASDPFNGERGFDVVNPESSGWRYLSRWELGGQKHRIWTHLAMHAQDELRQKTAWSLSQIVSVGLPDAKVSWDFEDTEAYLAFYDMFIKNGFGNYKKLMKEFSFNKIMANWLSFLDNQSLQYNIDNGNGESYPDENFAREIMQLFSIGLYKLNSNGTIKHDQNGKASETYSIDDIVSYSRAWTGFKMRDERGGAASGSRSSADTTLDPLEISVSSRDWFPKNNLLGGFIGDKVPLCAELPSKHFLRKDATYLLLGSNGVPTIHSDRDEWSQNPDFNHLELASSSPLYTKLCNANVSGECSLPAKVVLSDNLVYDAAAQLGAEYAVDTVRTLKFKVGSSYIWYEYMRQPCVEHSFYRDGKRLTKNQVFSDGGQNPSLCGNPLLEAATPMCSENAGKDGFIHCHYQGERVTFASAQAVCASNGLEQGYATLIREWKAGPCANGIGKRYFRSWANEACGLKVKVAFQSGEIAIIHNPEPDRSGAKNVEGMVDVDTLNFFATPWEMGAYPTINDCVAVPGCSVHGEEYCICDTDATDAIVYSSDSEFTSLNDIMDTLHIGAADPSSFDAGTYDDLGNCGIDGLTVYSPPGSSCTTLHIDTVFSFVRNSRSYFLKNSKSVVSIPGTSFSFRNPVQFISLSDPEKRDAYHETDEVLNSLFYHPSHAPFMSVRMIQRFGNSNPSPGFVERVVNAYTTGSYGQFGSGEYGDLGAMIAAILLDDESRKPVLDEDASHGHLREPLIKVLSFFRAMGLTYDMPLNIPSLFMMESKIGQGSFESPSVFSFFLPEFAPHGGIQSAGLVAPESMVLQGDNILFLLDSFWSTSKFGIVDCHWMGSFENWRYFYPFDCPASEGDYSLSPAVPSYLPQSTTTLDDIVDELDLLLTSGRLGANNRDLIKSVVNPIFLSGDIPKAVRAAQQLILSTPEYHSTNLSRKQGTKRAITGYTTKHKAPYKAVVILMMNGGADSWNMLVPKGGCSTGDSYEEYVAARGAHAIPKDKLISINATGSGQDCSEFGVNENFGLLADLYASREAAFFANTGVLSQPMTKNDDWQGAANSVAQLFAHNTQQKMFYTTDVFSENPGTGVMGRMLDKLKLKGLQTSANNVVKNGVTMLSGDQQFNNPVWTVGTSSPSDLNKYPTIENLLDVVKQLNGVGDAGNGLLSEYWSSRVASSLFEHEQLHELAGMGFEVSNYPETTKLSSSFKAVAGYMKSRNYRKVNRDVFFVTQGGYDMHFADTLAENFQEANTALSDFIAEVKAQGLWENTAIIMGSDFGRSMNPNSGGGTDHAWGGNYFMASGSLNGGRIMGSYPSPLGPESDYWLKRGRWIPSTPWDSVFNAVSQWVGIHDDEDLDWILPNRESFSTCNLFTDKDLFIDGACQCVKEGAVEYTICDNDTYSPTVVPTEAPSNTPTATPSASPTADLPDNGWLVTTILTAGSTVTHSGCSNTHSLDRVLDGTTERYTCNERILTENTTIIVTPEHGKSSIAKGLRLYTADTCDDCDPHWYTLEGRTDAESPWNLISSGMFPGIAEGTVGRNPRNTATTSALPIVSTYESADPNLSSTEVRFPSNSAAYFEYRISYVPRNPSSDYLRYAEIEMPGMLLPPEPSTSPTAAPSKTPTRAPSTSPTGSPSSEPTASPTANPSSSPTSNPSASPTADLPDNGWFVATILTPGSTVTHFGGCDTTHANNKVLDGTTERYTCNNRIVTETTAIIVTPEHGKLSIAKGLRLYTADTCQNCDPETFTVEGRIDAASPWDVIISNEPFPGIAEGTVGRNPRNTATTSALPIFSTYESADPSLSSTEVKFPSNSAAYLEYRISYIPRDPNSAYLRYGELEMPGMLLPPEPSTSPTAAPSKTPTKAPTASPTTAAPTSAVQAGGAPVATILTAGSTVTHFGCSNSHTRNLVLDGTTNRYVCNSRDLAVTTAIIVTPEHGQSSIAKGIRLYPADTCQNCDPETFTLEGRIDAASPWAVIVSNEHFPGIAEGTVGRNPRGASSLPIVSTYESADPNPNVHSTEFQFLSNSAAYFEYRISYIPRSPNSAYLRYGEIELPGILL